MLTAVESGEFLYTAMEKHPKIFPFIVTNMIKVGEMSGSLVDALEQAIVYITDDAEIKRKVRKTILPNVSMFFGILGLLIISTLVAIPQIQKIFDSIGSKESLPKATLQFQAFLEWFGGVWYIFVAIFIGLIVAFLSFKKTPRGRYKVDGWKYKMPVFGKLIYALDYSKLMRALVLNLKSGLRIQDALEISRNIIDNVVMVSLIEQAINQIYNGKSWIEPFEKSGLGTAMYTEMIKIGMETNLVEMIENLLEFIELDIDVQLEKIMKVLPEITYIFVGIVLIYFVLVILAPIIQAYTGSFMFSAFLEE